MTIQFRFTGFVLLAYGWSAAASAQPQWFILNTKPPSISRVDALTHAVTGDVPLSGMPGHALLAKNGEFLYVLLNGAFDLTGKPRDEASTLAIVDVRSMTLVNAVELGWRAHQFAMTPDGGHLVVRSAGRSQKKNAEEIPPEIIVVESSSNQVVARWKCPRKEIAFREQLEGVDVNNALLFSSDLSTIFDYNNGVAGGKEPAVPASVTVFSLGRNAPLRQITFPFAGATYKLYEKDHRSFAALSPDERWLYVVETGNSAIRSKNRDNGKVHVLDVATGKLAATHDVGYLPLKPVVDYRSNAVLIASDGSLGEGPGKLYRFSGVPAPKEWELEGSPLYIQHSEALGAHVVVTTEALRLLKDTGEIAETQVRLRNSPKRGGPKAETQAKNVPGRDFVVFPALGRMILGTYGYGESGGFYPEDDLAVIDLARARVERNLTIGRGSVKFGKGLAAFSLTMAVAMASGYAAYSVGSSTYVYPIFGVRAGGETTGTMASSPNQPKVWVLNPKTNDVTLVDAAKLTDDRKIAVGTGCGHIMTVTGDMACVVCDDELAVLDLKEETLAYKRKFSGAKLLDVGWDDRVHELVALISGGLVALDANGNVKAELTGLHEPMMLVENR